MPWSGFAFSPILAPAIAAESCRSNGESLRRRRWSENHIRRELQGIMTRETFSFTAWQERNTGARRQNGNSNGANPHSRAR
jgi:hypothetical protein